MPGSDRAVEQVNEVNVRHFEPGQFTGREENMARLMQWLEAAESRRVAIVGQGGSGKLASASEGPTPRGE